MEKDDVREAKDEGREGRRRRREGPKGTETNGEVVIRRMRGSGGAKRRVVRRELMVEEGGADGR